MMHVLKGFTSSVSGHVSEDLTIGREYEVIDNSYIIDDIADEVCVSYLELEPVVEQEVIKQPANLSITECNDLLQEASEAKPLADGWYERTTKYANDIIYVRGGQNYHHIHSLSSCHNLNGETLRPIKVDLS